MKNKDTTTLFFDKKIFIRDKDYLLTELKKSIESGEKLKIIFTPNSEQLVLAQNDQSFAETLGQADYLVPDGIGLVLGSRILSIFKGTKLIPQRIAGVDLVSDLLDIAIEKDLKVLILGGRNYSDLRIGDCEIESVDSKSSVEKLVETQKTTVATKIFWHEGFLNVSIPLVKEKKQISQIIKGLKPDIVFVCFGAPHQEQWVIENKQLLQQANVRVSMVVGGAFDMLLGKTPRAPKWVRKIGLEWLYRLYKEPWRWRRQLKLITFVRMIVKKLR
jgi:N-acetylglucosaminyldiphosphoundecaprenol N-acetyl-beta-D-mannosaminyltransferase